MEEQLIEFVKNNPFLYDRKHKYYKNAFMRDNKFEDLSTKLNVPAKKLKERWRTLRDKFYKEVKNERSSVNDDEIIPKKRWKWMDHLLFLHRDSTQTTKRTYEVFPREERFDSGASTSSTFQEQIAFSVADEIQLDTKMKMSEMLCLAKEIFTAPQAKPKSAAQLFFEGMAKQIDDAKLSPSEFTHLQMELLKTMNKVLYEIT